MIAGPAGGGYRPQTRWCGPHPFAPATGSPPRTSRSAVPAPDRALREVLLAQLARDLARGHWKLALRHFLMLEACGHDVPPAQRARCMEHALECPSRDWLRIRDYVSGWVRFRQSA